MDEDFTLQDCPFAPRRHRLCAPLLTAGLALLLCGSLSDTAPAQSGTSDGTARVMVNSSDRPVEVPDPIQAPPRIATPSPLPFDRHATSPPASQAGDAGEDGSTRTAPAEPNSRTPIRRDDEATTSPASPATTPVWPGLLIVAGTLAAVLLLVHFGRQLRPGPPELPDEALRQLGQQRLSPQVTLHLLQVGDRLLLVGVGSDGARTLTEVDDPAEVQQLIGFCRSGQPSGTAADRHPLLAWMAKDRLPRGNAAGTQSPTDRVTWQDRSGMLTAEGRRSDG